MSQIMYIFCDMNNGYMDLIRKKIRESQPGSVFTYSDFKNIADSATVRKSIERLAKENEIKKIMPGVFYNPPYSNLLKEDLPPDPEKVSEAIARNFKWNIIPCGDYALNKLGLSTQVPAEWSYLSDGPYKEYKFDKIKISFKHRTNREISNLSYNSALLVQGLKTLGKENVTDEIINQLSKKLKADDKKKLLDECVTASDWIYRTVQKICEEK